MYLCIARDMAFPLMLRLMQPYTGRMDSERFNQHLNRAHNQMASAFRRLKGIVHCLLSHLEMEHCGGHGSMLRAAQRSGAEVGGLPPSMDGSRRAGT